jgi:hypothetical protein
MSVPNVIFFSWIVDCSKMINYCTRDAFQTEYCSFYKINDIVSFYKINDIVLRLVEHFNTNFVDLLVGNPNDITQFTK